MSLLLNKFSSLVPEMPIERSIEKPRCVSIIRKTLSTVSVRTIRLGQVRIYHLDLLNR